SVNHLKIAVETVSGWIVGAGDFSITRVLLVLMLLTTVVVVAWAVRFSRLTTMLALFMVCFIGLLIASISFVDFHTPLDDRILSPVYLAGMALLVGATTMTRDKNAMGWCI